jgi:hypothetical protein
VDAGDGLDDGTGLNDVLEIVNALGFPTDGNMDTLDGYVRVGDEWMGYSHVDGLDATDTGADLFCYQEHRGLFGTTAVAHNPDEPVSFFPDYELWSVQVEDEQSKINVNTAPLQVISNLIQYCGINSNTPPSAPDPRQTDIAAAISSYRLYYSYWNTDDDIDDGEYTRFQNLNMVKNISFAPWFASDANPGGTQPISAEEFDLLRPYITVYSETPGGAVWINRTTLANDLNQGSVPDTYWWGAQVNDVSSVPVGSVVRISDTGGEVYRLVTSTAADPGGGFQLNTAIDGTATGWVDMAGVTGNITMMHSTDVPGADPYTPAYLLIQAPVGSEWVAISEVGINPATLNEGVYISARAQLGSLPVDYSVSATPISVQADTIGWRYLSALGGTDFAPQVPSAGPDAALFAAGADVDIENRHAININTVDNDIVLRSILLGIEDASTLNDISSLEADAIATELLDRMAGEAAPTVYDFFSGNEEWYDPAETDTTNPGDLHDVFDDLEFAGTIDVNDSDLLEDNFNRLVPSNWPPISTVPIRFDSGTLIGIESIGIVDDPSRTPVAQSPMLAQARVYDVIPPLEGTWWALRTQQEFYEYMASTFQTGGDQGYTGRFREDLPTAMLLAEDDYDDPADGIGTMAPGLDMLNPLNMVDTNVPHGTTLLMGLHDYPLAADFQLDYSVADDTPLTAPIAVDTSNTTAEGFTNVRLRTDTHYADLPGERHIEADSFDATIQPFAVQFWMRAGEDVTTTQLLVDVGDPTLNPDPTAHDALSQARVYLEDGQIVLRLDEPVYEPDAGCAGYVVARSNPADFPIEEGVWRHVAIAVVGTFKTEIAMFIDGIYDRNMEWEYYYVDDAGVPVATPADDTTVREGYYWPVASYYPNQSGITTKGPIADEWITGTNAIGLALDPSPWLPDDGDPLTTDGYIVIGDETNAYGYTSLGGMVTFPDALGNPVNSWIINLADPLDENHGENDAVAMMLPVARTAAHSGNYTAIADTEIDEISLWSHLDLGNGSYEQDAVSPTYDIGSHRSFAGYDWLGVDPTRFPLADGTDLLPDERWKVLVHHDEYVSATEGVLTGSLPTGPIGPDLSLGGARGDASIFEGEMDEVRITALPILTVPLGGWMAPATDATVVRWQWDTAAWNLPSLAAMNWPHMRPVNGSAFDMAEVVGSEFRKMADGGYFMVPDSSDDMRIYSYLTWPSPPDEQFFDIAEVNDDLTPTGDDGFQDDHDELRRVIPLSFLNTTRLPLGIAAGDTTIQLADIDQLPATGYVKIEDEILAYEQKNGATSELTLTAPFRRGCYGTSAGPHPAVAGNGGYIVRHLPVRHLDRYQTETAPGAWDVHTTYTDAQLSGQMCMLSYRVTHAGELSGVWWRLKEPLEDGQKLTVLVLIDDDDPGADGAWNEVPQSAAAPLLWGEVFSADGAQTGEIWCDREQVNTSVEVRFYFDLSETHAYMAGYDTDGPGGPDTDQLTGSVLPAEGWEDMIELDEVGIEMVPQQMTF